MSFTICCHIQCMVVWTECHPCEPLLLPEAQDIDRQVTQTVKYVLAKRCRTLESFLDVTTRLCTVLDAPLSAAIGDLQLAGRCCLTPSAIAVLSAAAIIRLPFRRERHKEQLLTFRSTNDDARGWAVQRGGASLQVHKCLVHCSACY